MTERRLYGVSTGDGSNGVSHVFVNYEDCIDYEEYEYEEYECEEYECEEYEYEEYECEECGGTGQVPDDTYESGPCPFVLEVFPANEDETRKRPIYGSIEDALTDEAIARAKDRD